MRVRLKQTMSGPAGVFSTGAVVDLPDAEATDLVARGQAEAVDPETAEGDRGAETAAAPVARRRR